MSYLLLALGFFIVYFLSSWIVVYFFKPRVPRHYFLLFLIFYAAVYGYSTRAVFSLADDVTSAAWFCGFALYILACFTMWNSFYSILWGFSGGLLADFCADPALCKTDSIIHSYQGTSHVSADSMDRMLKRRIPSLEKDGILVFDKGTYKVGPKGQLIAVLTLILYRFFNLGRGGGIVEEA